MKNTSSPRQDSTWIHWSKSRRPDPKGRRMKRRIHCLFVVITLVAVPTCATTIDPLLWEEMAVRLARRGDKRAMDKLVRRFPGLSRQASGMVRVPYRNLMKRTLVLLSNSAAYSRVPRPPHDLYDRNIPTWWEKYRKRIVLHDPWLDMLRRQKVD